MKIKVFQINVYQTIGSIFATSEDMGNKVYEKIYKCIKNNKKTIISFSNIEILTFEFLNCFIGRLYGDFSKDIIESSVIIVDLMDEQDYFKINHVIENSKKYFSNKNINPL